MARKILVVGSEYEAQTAHQIKKLQDHGSDVHVFSADLPPSEVRFSWGTDGIVVDGF